MRLLITGGAGFIGSHLQDRLIRLNHQVVIVDNLSTGKRTFLNPKSIFFKSDIRDKKVIDRIFYEFKPDVVFHLAAQSNIPNSINDPQNDIENNVLGTLNILENCRKYKVGKIIYSSSGAVYGNIPKKHLPIKEDEFSPIPTSPYGVSKLSAELYLKLYGNLFGIKWIILRYSNVYGPRQETSEESGVVAIFITKLLVKDQPIIFGDGLHVRDYIYIDSIVEANIKALKYNDNNVFNVSAGNQITTLQVFDTIESFLKTGIKPKFGPERFGDIRVFNPSNHKARRVLKWRPGLSFPKSIKLTIDYYKNNEKS